MGHVLLFSLTAMANPTLIAVTTVMLLLSDPKRLMLAYLLGALLVSVTLGLVIVFALQDAGSVDTAKRTVDPAVDLAVGGLLLVVAFTLATGRERRLRERRRDRKDHTTEKGEPRWRRALDHDAPRRAFLVGIVLTLPGASYLAALTSITRLDPGTVETVLLVLMVNAIMLLLLEAPLVGYTVAPEWTPVAVAGAKRWMATHAQRIAVVGASGVGSLLILRGAITLAG